MLRPESEAALAEAVRAGARGRPVGGGTRLLPGEAGGIETRALTGVTLYEPAALTLVVAAGTPLAEVEALLAAEGQMLPFEPDPRPGSTIGGVCAANASGPRRILAGACRDAMLGVRFVDGTGAVVANGGRVMKNVTGLDLVKLMAGSRGRLGVLTEVALRTAPRPPSVAVLRLTGLDAAAAIAPLTAALTGPYDASAALWTPEDGAVIRLEGLPRSVALRTEALKSRLAPAEITVSDQPLLSDPNILGGESRNATGGQTAPPSTPPLWRIVLRPSQAAPLLQRLPRPERLDWGGALILVRTDDLPDLPPGAIASRLTGAPDARPARDPRVAALEADLAARFDPRGAFA